MTSYQTDLHKNQPQSVFDIEQKPEVERQTENQANGT